MASSIARPHVPEEELHAFADGELSPGQRAEIAEHLLGCLICRSQQAEVDALRTRASAILAIAAPRVSRPAAKVATVASFKRRVPRMVAVAAAAVIGVGVWFAMQNRIAENGTTQLASTLGLSGEFRLSRHGSDAAATRARELVIAGRFAPAPEVKGVDHGGPFAVATRTVRGGEIVDPVVASEWAVATVDSALKIADGKLARIGGLPVSVVRMHPSTLGGRPTFLVRQSLPDGHAVWVLEGLESDISSVDQVVQASGIAMSMAARTKPDYVNSGTQTAVTTRMVRVVGYLPADSLNALAAKLILR